MSVRPIWFVVLIILAIIANNFLPSLLKKRRKQRTKKASHEWASEQAYGKAASTTTVSTLGEEEDWHEPASELERGGFNEPNTWCEPLATNFKVRTKDYLNPSSPDYRTKLPSEPAVFRPIGVQTYMNGNGASRIFHAAANVPTLMKLVQENPKSFFFFVGWVIPGPPYRTAIFAFERRLPTGADPIVEGLVDLVHYGTDEERQSRIKYIPSIKVAPWLVQTGIKTLGGEKPTMLCKKLRSEFYAQSNYLEVDIDVGSNPIANSVTGLVLPSLTNLVIEHGFLLEGTKEEELPERLLGAIRIQQADLVMNCVTI